MAQEKLSALACAADIKSKCGEVKPGEGRIRTCVKEHLSEFSEPCQAKLAKLAAVGQACAADVKQACGDAKPRRGRIVACIRPSGLDLNQEFLLPCHNNSGSQHPAAVSPMLAGVLNAPFCPLSPER
jgi:hypothetical protein